MKLSFSLNKPKPAAPAAPPPSPKRPAAFAFGDDDEPIDAAPTASLSNDKSTAANKKLLAQNVQSSRTMQKRMDAEKRVDSTVYEYDEVWDKMQESKQRQKEAKELESKDRKPKYIHGLLTASTTRKLDYLRAEEKMMQLEREAEGDEFKDKESFVTQAYKDQMAAVRAAEEEEKKRDELLKKQGGASSGMAHFYRKLLEDSEQKHDATVAATQKPDIGPQPNLTITKPPDFTPISDLELAKKAREEGKEVELNDDNQIVDKRDLLVAGLNLSAPNTRRLGDRSNTGKDKNSGEEVQAHRAVGTAATRREINERRAREIQQQMEAEEERLKREKDRTDHEAMQRIIAKRNDEDAVQSARERYLQRKRQRLEADVAVEVKPD
ncbi:coiled-coil domain-containing protein 55-domain containing protein [Mycena maculata]|uniref:Coiled-coil domain-containing protein 55-domain containing protein n=1 Tax=Mycena maculata TaxID=230809 RepID=A0AAD7JYG0_9AGAR|nr:coiled-coil domain-containing protein 55-domain containing protein [Mycena maculata]